MYNEDDVFKGNLQPYEDPLRYDEKNDPFTKDIAFFKKWASKKSGPVVELACGTGRVTIPLAKSGIHMMGVDIHPGMLKRAEEKGKENNVSISFLEQDCCALCLPVQTDFMFMTGNSFQHFLTNDSQDLLLQAVKEHLVKGGIFVFGTRFAQTEELREEVKETVHEKKGNTEITYELTERYDALNQVLYCETDTLIKGEVVDVDRIKLRYVFPQELKRLLDANGFKLKELYGDWDETPLAANSTNIVVVCEKKESQ
ncbi:class I SAM-dependent methyltransferase [Alteribacter aurantiacus]|uniref:class I SAM-dependent methyltransferase n=1 Tax=Alteribacter aurantiacus TaxID=254410 RepID=UPI0004113B7F|nr:class I SAM-dependent methyltransferase [Alteribacter aurantiacus]